MDRYKRVAQLRTPEDFRAYIDTLGIDLPFDTTLRTGPDSPLAQPAIYGDRIIGNRFCVLPMEGWDGTYDGRPTELTARRWHHFGASGAKLIWGCEAVAVRHDGRANPRQLMITADTWADLARLREQLVAEHALRHGRTDDLLIGLQLTHSGRFARPEPDNMLRPAILYAHPILNRKFGFTEDYPVLSDDDVRRLIDDFIVAAQFAKRAGFDFVDLKHCHGYLGHEFLSAVDRNGRYGGSFENRTRFLRELVEGIRAEVPGLDVGVRLSAFDWAPFRPGPDGVGEMECIDGEYRYAFGGDGTGMGIDLREPYAFLDLLCGLNIRLVCITAGSPYYNPHIQRPALFPPSDGYQPPEDPLVGVARQIAVVARLKAHRPELLYVGSGYSYLQEWLPHVAQCVVRTGMTDFVGLGRLILSYPEAPADILAGRPLQRKRLCRTFSDCTTAPRNGLVSGCYPLDEFYKQREEAIRLQEIKARIKST
ncbi:MULTISPECIES: oxidoreductase [Caldilinea]|jgi:2,4-dienoyl-CoA reductase-like NADH-dependent reductase (Old Yellow Enzyme family)|uniref:Putative NADH-dependent oxidoreductase n=1 Tax=Caldilinea aerophila (strain DSM 14535 / JCM 11387 / NBRC 104270 / STL-6-O1) TaxID=926550 RepID=I0I306_CALAS|nr:MULTISPECIES: NADH:flavin oxidoreductase [Caldilinea]MBO9393531.1 NADH:flavin oxidoreductase [Caldilinea sp.]BAL99643.1 putative NADH-dependent oxidoreductase [Caldilinea aerophila DSM 14535 = NBRC 104270]GIV73758.1 MAG: NADH:flavin oxidoreductase [Caldilinea sp.]